MESNRDSKLPGKYKQDIQDEIDRLDIQIERLRKEGYDGCSPEIAMRQSYIELLKSELKIWTMIC